MKKILTTSLLLILTILVVGCETNDYNEPVYAQMVYDEVVPIFVIYNVTETAEFEVDCYFNSYNNHTYLDGGSVDFSYEDIEHNYFEFGKDDTLYSINTIQPELQIFIPRITNDMHRTEIEQSGHYKCDNTRIFFPVSYNVFWNETLMYSGQNNCFVFINTNNDDIEDYEIRNEIQEECFNQIWWNQ